MKESKTSDVVDLGEATALVTLGFNLVELQPSNTGTFKVFVFETIHPNSSTISLNEVIENYQRRKLQVDAYSFFRSLTEMKRKIYHHNERMEAVGH